MNKNVKAAAAVAAGAVLLLGGGGTLALWNTSSDINSSSIGTGVLDFGADVPDGAWYDYAEYTAWVADGADEADQPDAISDPANYKLVPEDKLIFVIEGVPVTADGASLYFTVTPDLGSIALSDADGPITDGEDHGITIGDATVTASGFGTALIAGTDGDFADSAAVAAGTPVYHVTSAVNGTFDASFVLSFDADATDDQGLTVDLSDGAVKIQQVIKTN